MFDWKEKYVTGIGEIDAQHKNLVEMINKLFAAMQSGAGKELLDTTLQGLIDYTRYHFITEEMYMQRSDYPDLELHRIEHRHMTEQVQRFEQEYRAGNSGISIQLITFLRNWLDDHICETDHKYIPYLKEKGFR